VHLYNIPIVFVLVGLGLYAVLGGADFGAGVWQLLAGSGPGATRIRDHAHHSMAPVWEANHVWLIFVLTVMWTAYPAALGSIASTLGVPLFIAGIGIVFRGAAYALRAGTSSRRELRGIDLAFSISSVITPFALGTMIGAIAARRVPVGNAAGSLIGSWTGALPIAIGLLFVVSGSYLAAVYLAADAARHSEAPLEDAFRRRALGAGVVAGAVAVAGLVVVHGDAHFLYHGLIDGDGLAAVIVSALAGVATLALVGVRRFELARFSAAVAVAAMIAGWALAQQPLLLPGLTIHQAAAGHDTLVAVIVAVLAGAVILLPSLGLLFRLVLAGHLDEASEGASAVVSPAEVLGAASSGIAGRVTVALFVAAIGLLTLADASWAHAIGVVCLFGFGIAGFVAVAPWQTAAFSEGSAEQ
jgi:cytochrome d ubiquinol oxidase subunit II